MKSRKKIIFNGVFLAVVFALTIYGVSRRRSVFHDGCHTQG